MLSTNQPWLSLASDMLLYPLAFIHESLLDINGYETGFLLLPFFFQKHITLELIRLRVSFPSSLTISSNEVLCLPRLLLPATACRYPACLTGGGASTGQTKGARGGAHRGKAQPAQISASKSPVPPDPGLAEVCPAAQRPGLMSLYLRPCLPKVSSER